MFAQRASNDQTDWGLGRVGRPPDARRRDATQQQHNRKRAARSGCEQGGSKTARWLPGRLVVSEH
eukprot:4892269-Alexandrium_andersonii.AAC.1